MAGASLLALLDDITSVLDDVALLSKLAAKKTTGVLGDDLALNAQQVSGVRADRELPVVWAVAKGSMRNKLILVPAALAISAWAPWAVVPLLMVGGAYLCFEGFEKLAHKFLHRTASAEAEPPEASPSQPSQQQDVHALEREKVQGAIRTDFVLSAEIIAITLGTVAEASFDKQLLVLSAIAVLMTVGVYGLVAAIVKLDDAGLYLNQRASRAAQSLGRGILALAPWLMRALAVAGTIAMFLVGGGILSHGVHALHEAPQRLAPLLGPAAPLAPLLVDAAVGLLAGALSLLLVTLGQKVWRMRRAH